MNWGQLLGQAMSMMNNSAQASKLGANNMQKYGNIDQHQSSSTQPTYRPTNNGVNFQ